MALLALPTAAFRVAQVSGNSGSLIADRIGEPLDLDPAWAYDTASGELLMNVYDALLAFNRTNIDTYIPRLATSWYFTTINETSPEGLHWVRRLTFTIWTGVHFQTASPPMGIPGEGAVLTPTDVEYTFERLLVTDASTGPSWMVWEPLFGAIYAGDLDAMLTGLGWPVNATTGWNTKLDEAIDHAVESNATHVWFNMVMPYEPILQILSQCWGSIVNQAWCVWHGDWPGISAGDDWYLWHDPPTSPLYSSSPASPGPNLDAALGTGPYMLDYWNKGAGNAWSIIENPNYWEGWTVPFRHQGWGSSETAIGGHVDRYTSYYIPEWSTRKLRFLGRTSDFCDVPRNNISEVLGQPGINCVYPLPQLTCFACFFNFQVNINSTYMGVMQPAGTFNQYGAPPNIMDDKNFRLAITHMFNYTSYLEAVLLNESNSPVTPIIPGITYYDPSIGQLESPSGHTQKKYGIAGEPVGQLAYDVNLAKTYLQAAWDGQLWANGFTFSAVYSQNNSRRQIAATLIKGAFDTMNALYGTKFTINVVSVPGSTYNTQWRARTLPYFIVGWLADYPDAHNFANPFMHSAGAFSRWQGILGVTSFPNALVDAHIDDGFATVVPAERQGNYTWLQQYYVDNAPGFCTDQPIGRHWERDWVRGWYYNPVYPGNYIYDLWMEFTGPGFHDVGITDKRVSPDLVRAGESNVTIYVDARNFGTFPETFNVTVYADLNLTVIGDEITIGVQPLSLPARSSTTLNFTWNTKGVPAGNYRISAAASNVPEDVDLTNNLYTDGQVAILASVPCHSWSNFRHDPEHTGYIESPAPNTNQTLWNCTTGDAGESSPAVVDGRVYVGSDDGKVYCLNALTGAQIWNCTTDDWVVSSPVVVDGKVYVGSVDHKVYCLDALTGASVWNCTTGGPVFSSPAVVDGRVYVGSDDHKVYCLNALTGASVWNYTTGSAVWSCPAVADGRVYVGSDDHKVYCLDALTGASVWNCTTGGAVKSSPAVVDGRVYVGSDDHKVYCLNALTGASVWNYTTGSAVESCPAVVDGRVYVGSYDHKVYCLDALTGAHVWNYTTGNVVWSSPAVADGKVYVGSDDGEVYCLDALTGASVWNYTTGDYVASSPAIADGVVYIGSGDYKVYAFGNVVRAEDHPTIQEAINVATEEATIWIAAHTYNESIVVNKTLTIIGLMGSSPIFRGGGSGTCMTLLRQVYVSIVGIVITNWDRGIIVADSANCKIYDNIMSSINKNGIVIEGTNAANNTIYNNIFQQNFIAMNLTASSAKNAVYKNIIISNTIGLKLETGGNVIYANSIAQNEIGINISSSGNIIYHNNFIDNTVQVSMSPSASNTWDDGYPSGGNYWSACTWVDKFSGPGQNLTGSDGVNDTGYAITQYNIDRYPLLQPFSRHDIGITEVIPSKTVVAKGFTLYVDVRILNYGVYSETFVVTVYASTTIIGQETITVALRSSMTANFAWDTASVVKTNYTVYAVVDVLPDETDWSDNALVNGTVTVTTPGDVTGDIWVDMQDISILIDKFFATPTDPRWDPNCDVDNDFGISMADISIAIENFMRL